MSKQNPLKEAIHSYLDGRAKVDELFAVAYKKKNKSIDECCTYIMGEAKKRGKYKESDGLVNREVIFKTIKK